MPDETSPTDRAAPLRVLLLHMESTGSGHRRAAEAIGAALDRSGEDVRYELVNVVDYMNDTLHELYQAARTRILADAPHVVGQMYSWYDRQPSETSLFDRLLDKLQHQSMRRLMDRLRQDRPDVAIHTHFFPAEVTAELRRRGEVDFPHLTVTTDLFSHAMWVHEPCERYFAATEEARVYMTHLGAPREKVEVSGIPIDPAFEDLRVGASEHERASRERGQAIRQGAAPRILFMATGLSPDTAADGLGHLLRTERGLSVTVLAGGDEARRTALGQIEVPQRHDVQILGHRDDVGAIMAGSDLLAGKGGGLTVAECMALGLPMAILQPRPDQEEQNTDYLLEKGAAVRIYRRALLPYKLEEILSDEERWMRLRRSAHALGRPNAARRVAEVASAYARERRAISDGLAGLSRGAPA